MDHQTVYDYIISEEANYQTMGVPVVDGWEWKMYDHIRYTTLFKNGQLSSGKRIDDDKPVKNIIRPILNVQYRSEGFDVKDIEIFVNDEKNYYKSFLTKKFHNRYARKYNLDTFIDDVVESYVDYGGSLDKDVNQKCPTHVPMQRIAFCDQTDMLSAPLCEKHSYNPDDLIKMKGKWYDDKINEAIDMSVSDKSANVTMNAQKAKTPGKYIDVYELHGMLPKRWLSKEEGDEYDVDDKHEYVQQVHYIAFPTAKSREEKNGICLYKGKERPGLYKRILRDKIFGRALGFGGVEELFQPQIWTTYSMIKMKDMLDAASLMILQTADQAFATKNKTSELETGEFLVHADGKPITQVALQPVNMPAFENAVAQWELHARTTGSANDAQLGISPSSGTPLGTTEIVTQMGMNQHEYRRGKIAEYFAEIYRDWILEDLVKEMNEGDKWVDMFSVEEMQYIVQNVATNEINKTVIDTAVSTGRVITQEEADQLRALMIEDFHKNGSKKFVEIFKNELKGIPVDVEVNVAGKQKDLNKLTEKLTNIFRQVIANPQVLTLPPMAKLFNEILEAAGLSPADFSQLTAKQVNETMTPQPAPAETLPASNPQPASVPA